MKGSRNQKTSTRAQCRCGYRNRTGWAPLAEQSAGGARPVSHYEVSVSLDVELALARLALDFGDLDGENAVFEVGLSLLDLDIFGQRNRALE